MVRITSVAAFIFAFAFGTKDKADRSLAPLQSAYGGEERCEDVCMNAKRNKDGAACAAGGAWSSVSAWNVQFREPCE
ncbi:unnamed protein product [Alternaria alternata]